ncbi:MAG TPA: hypothetical protein DEB15_16430, partial [Pusillimonas sp.]|nr:hypothetical protein [Pusillimonas sp.]
AFAAANIAGCDGSKAGWAATRVGWCSYIVPFLFALSPSLLMEGTLTSVLWTVTTASIGILAGTVAVVGYFSTAVNSGYRVLFMVAGLLMLIPADTFSDAGWTDVVGVILMAILTGLHFLNKKREATTPAT